MTSPNAFILHRDLHFLFRKIYEPIKVINLNNLKILFNTKPVLALKPFELSPAQEVNDPKRHWFEHKTLFFPFSDPMFSETIVRMHIKLQLTFHLPTKIQLSLLWSQIAKDETSLFCWRSPFRLSVNEDNKTDWISFEAIMIHAKCKKNKNYDIWYSKRKSQESTGNRRESSVDLENFHFDMLRLLTYNIITKNHCCDKSQNSNNTKSTFTLIALLLNTSKVNTELTRFWQQHLFL